MSGKKESKNNPPLKIEGSFDDVLKASAKPNSFYMTDFEIESFLKKLSDKCPTNRVPFEKSDYEKLIDLIEYLVKSGKTIAGSNIEFSEYANAIRSHLLDEQKTIDTCSIIQAVIKRQNIF